MSSNISVVINTYNEERNLPFALKSVSSWADEIIVVDMYSEDRTVEIAKSYHAKVFHHEKMGYADPARSFAVSNASNQWILILDADEIIPKPLSLELVKIASENRFDTVSIPRLNYYFGKKLLHSGFGPEQDRQMRFFRKGLLALTDEVHNFLKPEPGARILSLSYRPGLGIVHFNYINVEQFVNKTNTYTTVEACQRFYKGEIHSTIYAVFRSVRGFFRRYIWDRGYKDGWRGMYVSLFWVFYRLLVFSKMMELNTYGDHPRETVESIYHLEAEKIIAEYNDVKNP